MLCIPIQIFQVKSPTGSLQTNRCSFRTLYYLDRGKNRYGVAGEDTMWHANTVHPPVIAPLRETFHWPTCLCVSLSDFATIRTCTPLVIHLSGGTFSEKLIGWHWMVSICHLPSLDRKQYGGECIRKLDSHRRTGYFLWRPSILGMVTCVTFEGPAIIMLSCLAFWL